MRLKSPAPSLVPRTVKRPLIGSEKKGPIGLGGCDIASESFKCTATSLSINEVVKGGNACGGGKGKGFQ